MKVKELIINPKNPRLIKNERFELLKRSIQEFPKMMELRPIVYDPATMHILGGNMRFKALQELGYKEIPDTWIRSADQLTDEEKQRFIIEDNVPFGEWDYQQLNEWDSDDLSVWGLELPSFEELKDEYGESFTLKDGDKEPFQQMTFTLADEQAEQIKNAIADIKQTDEYKYAETMGNENSNGNALYLIVMQWAEQRK